MLDFFLYDSYFELFSRLKNIGSLDSYLLTITISTYFKSNRSKLCSNPSMIPSAVKLNLFPKRPTFVEM